MLLLALWLKKDTRRANHFPAARSNVGRTKRGETPERAQGTWTTKKMRYQKRNG